MTVIDSEVTEHEFDISLGRVNSQKNTNAAVTVQKSAHRILLYGFKSRSFLCV